MPSSAPLRSCAYVPVPTALLIQVASLALLALATAPSFAYMISMAPASSLTVQRSDRGTITHQQPWAIVSLVSTCLTWPDPTASRLHPLNCCSTIVSASAASP